MDTYQLKPQYVNKLFTLDQGGKVVADYIWIDGSGINLRSKARTLNQKISHISEIPEWNCDGSSTYQAPVTQSELVLKPVAFFRDPFRKGDNILVMCDTWIWKDNTCEKLIPANTNFRHFAKKIFATPQIETEEPLIAFDQEYNFVSQSTKFTKKPLGWPRNGFPGSEGPYYCSVGADVTFGRPIADLHFNACNYAGLKVTEFNSEIMPGQWKYRVGPVSGIDIGDQLWVSRFLLVRIAEDFNVGVSFSPKLFPNWNGSGCHTSFSTKTMRSGEKGLRYIH